MRKVIFAMPFLILFLVAIIACDKEQEETSQEIYDLTLNKDLDSNAIVLNVDGINLVLNKRVTLTYICSRLLMIEAENDSAKFQLTWDVNDFEIKSDTLGVNQINYTNQADTIFIFYFGQVKDSVTKGLVCVQHFEASNESYPYFDSQIKGSFHAKILLNNKVRNAKGSFYFDGKTAVINKCL